MRRIFIAFVLAACAAPSSAGAQTAPRSAVHAPTQTVTVRPLPGGATLVVWQEPTATETVIEAFFRVGVADENSGNESGMSALLARAWTADTTNRTSFQIARDIGAFGTLGVWSAGEYIELWTASRPEDASVAAQTLLMNVVSAPTFPPAAVQGAKAAVARDRELRDNTPIPDALERLRGRVFGASAQGRDPLGDAALAGAASPDGLRRFYARTAGGDGHRAVFVVAGVTNADDAERLVVSSLAAGGWNALHPPPARARRGTAPPVSAAPDVIPAGLKPLDAHRAAPARTVIVGWLAPGTGEGAQTWATLHVLDAVIAGGKACRLFALRDTPGEGAAPIGYDVRGSLEPGRTQSLYAAIVTGATGSAEETSTLIRATARAAADGSAPITADELARAVSTLRGKHRRERERLTERASAAGLAELGGLGARFEADYDEAISAVTLPEVNALARRVFGGNSVVVATGGAMLGQ